MRIEFDTRHKDYYIPWFVNLYLSFVNLYLIIIHRFDRLKMLVIHMFIHRLILLIRLLDSMKWSKVEDSGVESAFIGGFVIFCGAKPPYQTLYHISKPLSNLISSILGHGLYNVCPNLSSFYATHNY